MQGRLFLLFRLVEPFRIEHMIHQQYTSRATVRHRWIVEGRTMCTVRRTLSMTFQLLLSAPFRGWWNSMMSPSFKDDLRFAHCITSVVFKDNVGIDVCHLVAMVTNLSHPLSSFHS